MGAWGSGPFDNDDAMDWAANFVEAKEGLGNGEETKKFDLLLGPLAVVMGDVDGDEDVKEGDEGEGEEYVDAELASHAIAAAEVIAAVLGKAGPDLAGTAPKLKLSKDDEKDDEKDEDKEGDPDNNDLDMDDEENDPVAAIASWIRSVGKHEEALQQPGIRDLAVEALSKIREESELADLWSDAEPADAAAWLVHIDGLIKRLTS